MTRQKIFVTARVLKFLTSAVLVSCLFFSGSPCEGVIALDLGVQSPIGWQGTGARFFTGPGQIVTEDLNLGLPNTQSYIAYDGADSYGWVETEPYSAHGYIEVYPTLPPGETHSSGGFFRDEIYVASASGNPVRLEFEFELSATIELWDLEQGESIADLSLSMAYYPDGASSFSNGTIQSLDFQAIRFLPVQYEEEEPGEPLYVYYEYEMEQEDWHEGMQTLLTVDETSEGYLDFYDSVAMTTDGHSNGGLVASGTWLPISVGLWGAARDASINWGEESLHLYDVYAYDGLTGELLAPEEYVAFSLNGNFPSNGEIPEPTSLALLLLGGFVLQGQRVAAKGA